MTSAAEIEIAGRKIGTAHPPYIIAEIAGNHLRSAARARVIFEEAIKAGVDAIKLETYLPSSLAIEIAPEQLAHKPQWIEAWGWGTGDIYNLYRQLYTPREFFKTLFELGKEMGITVFSTPFGVEDARWLAAHYNPPAYKLGALEIDFFPLLEVVAATGKPLLINTAIATADKIQRTLEFLKSVRSGPVALMTGPKVYHEDSAASFGLGRLAALHERFGAEHVLGLSDHFRGGTYDGKKYLGHEFSTEGVQKFGVGIIEKHFCGVPSGLPARALRPDGTIDWDRSDLDGVVSLTTEAMATLVKFGKLAHAHRTGAPMSADATQAISTNSTLAAIGYGEKFIGPSKAEIETNEAGATRFVYAVHDLPAGHTLALSDLHFSRAIHHANPAWARHTPLPTSTVPQLVGARLTRAVEKGDPIFTESLNRTVDLKKPYEAGLFPIA